VSFASCPNKELATPVPDLRDKATPVLWAVRVPISFSRAAASRPGPGARLHLRTAVLPGLLILATASFSAACFKRLSAVGGGADKSSPIFGGPRDHDFSLVSAVSIGPNNRQRMSGLHERTLAWPSRTSIRTYGIWHRLQLCKPVHTG